eukprot:TRINITY_DN2789_c0_g1_i1.p1 TRINITY_DN2789_c0_g1~~TRINITY_DN2789_c0_g1_i1.p1  ORF type:complete len:245 (+),score=31.27 TRINITY_DN2789_c0_g1_i1:164-898(+)
MLSTLARAASPATLRSCRAASRALGASAQPSRNLAAAAAVQAGDSVQVHYVGTFDDGTVFDTSRQEGRDPLKFTVGSGQVIKGFDLAVMGLGVGDTNKLRCEPQDAYGEWSEDYVTTVPPPAEGVPKDLEAGMWVQLSNGMPATVKEIKDDGIVIDANHVLAGKALTFEVELLELEKEKQNAQRATSQLKRRLAAQLTVVQSHRFGSFTQPSRLISRTSSSACEMQLIRCMKDGIGPSRAAAPF